MTTLRGRAFYDIVGWAVRSQHRYQSQDVAEVQTHQKHTLCVLLLLDGSTETVTVDLCSHTGVSDCSVGMKPTL